MKELSDWQSARVRDALRAYHRYERGAKGEFFTWKDVREAIAFYIDIEIGTGAKNGAERLRQFVEGVPDINAPGGRKFSGLQPAALEAAIKFAMHEELNLLSEDELNEFVPSYQAPMRLLEYLDQNFDKERLVPPAGLEGCYRSPSKSDEDGICIRELTLQRGLYGGLIQVIETEDFYNEKIDSIFESLSPDEKRMKRSIRHNYGGWAILTPEYNLLFFMKEENTGMNRYYFTLASNITLKLDKPMNGMALLYHDYPFEPEENRTQDMDEIIKELIEELPNNLFAFKRC